ncbi:hypothetical protein SPHV1_2400043 [Novosphingobium sp. KN65.2]|nr:hypothetical protein SPHV1_2400043 [Novosphingobium sp. KN65.2]
MTRDMRSQLPPCQPTPPRAWAVWSQFNACTISPRGLPLADTLTAYEADVTIAENGALDCPDFILTHARNTKSFAATGHAFGNATGIFEQNRATTADPAGIRRVWRSHNGNAHAHRCAPPGRNAGGGTQGKSH